MYITLVMLTHFNAQILHFLSCRVERVKLSPGLGQAHKHVYVFKISHTQRIKLLIVVGDLHVH